MHTLLDAVFVVEEELSLKAQNWTGGAQHKFGEENKLIGEKKSGVIGNWQIAWLGDFTSNHAKDVHNKNGRKQLQSNCIKLHHVVRWTKVFLLSSNFHKQTLTNVKEATGLLGKFFSIFHKNAPSALKLHSYPLECVRKVLFSQLPPAPLQISSDKFIDE